MPAAHGMPLLFPDELRENNLFVCDFADEQEYMVAADLTLYSNPLNRALNLAGRLQHNVQAKQGQRLDEKETIAADMTKYDSPMADLDKRRDDKQRKEEKKTNE